MPTSQRTSSGPGPSHPFDNGRDANGRFAKGNHGGPGSPYSRQVHALRRALLNAVTESDVQAVAQGLIEQARGGSVPAAKELLSRCLGPAVALDLVERLEAVEHIISGSNGDHSRGPT